MTGPLRLALAGVIALPVIAWVKDRDPYPFGRPSVVDPDRYQREEPAEPRRPFYRPKRKAKP